MARPSVENLLTIAALGLLVSGCFLVLAPFLSALLWAVIVCFSTWGIYQALLTALGGRKSLSALLMTLTLAAVLLAPLLLVATGLGDNAQTLTRALSHVVEEGMPPAPDWLSAVPLVGQTLSEYWNTLRLDTGGSAVVAWLQQQAAPVSKWLLGKGLAFGQALLQVTLSVFAAFYLYRDGIAVAARFNSAMERIAGARAHHLIDLAASTVKGVVYGILGTALAQGSVAAIGFSIAGVPGPLLLGLLTCVLSIIPAAPPLIWVPATLWVFNESGAGWGLFMLLWGLFAISGIDNVVKPYLISQGSELPFLLVLLGVIGGVLSFGFIGIFLGPTLLAVGYALLREYTRVAAARRIVVSEDKTAESG